ncbi:MAG: SsrA-binding protein SmpB [Candidatus Andersenbacteria bacterium]
MAGKTLAVNKRAKFDFELLETFEAGLQLLGTEVKSIKAGHISIKGSFVTIHDSAAILTNATIPAWQPKNTFESYDPTRPRKLLLKKAELNTIIGSKQTAGLTIIPVRVYMTRGKIKLEIALAKGKKKHDKKQAKKEADIMRETDRILRGKESE